MAHVISFRTTKFDPAAELPNPINPIAGHSVLAWLRDHLASAGYRTTEPDTEDWGWYMDVEGNGGAYLVGASGDAQGSKEPIEWVIQVHRTRSLKDKLFGSNRMTAEDPLSALIERILRSDPAFEVASVDREP